MSPKFRKKNPPGDDFHSVGFDLECYFCKTSYLGGNTRWKCNTSCMEITKYHPRKVLPIGRFVFSEILDSYFLFFLFFGSSSSIFCFLQINRGGQNPPWVDISPQVTSFTKIAFQIEAYWVKIIPGRVFFPKFWTIFFPFFHYFLFLSFFSFLE